MPEVDCESNLYRCVRFIVSLTCTGVCGFCCESDLYRCLRFIVRLTCTGAWSVLNCFPLTPLGCVSPCYNRQYIICGYNTGQTCTKPHPPVQATLTKPYTTEQIRLKLNLIWVSHSISLICLYGSDVCWTRYTILSLREVLMNCVHPKGYASMEQWSEHSELIMPVST